MAAASTTSANVIFLATEEKLSVKEPKWPEFKARILIVLSQRGLLSLVDGSEPEPDGKDPAVLLLWKDRNSKAIAQIALNLVGELVLNIPPTAKELWDRLTRRFEHVSAMARMVAMDHLNGKVMASGEGARSHFDEVNRRAEVARAAGSQISDNDLMTIYMKSLGDVFDSMAGALYAATDPEQLVNIVLMEETRRSSRVTSTNPVALKVRERFFCTNCKRPYHTVEKCWSPGGGAEGQAPTGWKPRPLKQAANVATTVEQAPTTERRYFALMANGREPSDAWYADSGASAHMAKNRNVFAEYHPVTHYPISSASPGQDLVAIGKGTVIVESHHGGTTSEITLSNVLHVPNITANLISVSQLEDSGVVSGIVAPGTFAFAKGGGIFAIATRVDGLYQMDWSAKHDSTLIASSRKEVNAPLELWHRRLGHAGEDDIVAMSRAGTATGLDLASVTSTGRCEPCVPGKMTRDVFESRGHRAAEVFDTVVSDLIGEMQVPSFSGAKYALTITDDHSSYTWITFLTNKHEATNAIRDFVTMVSTQFGRKVKRFHTDNGGEYVNVPLSQFFKANGIIHDTTAPYSPQQNGIAERKGRTLFDMARTQLFDSGLPAKYWAESVNHAVYIRNRLTTSALPNRITPYQSLYGKVPSVAHLRPWGCQAFAKIPDQIRQKLNPKAIKGRFIGCYDDAAYKIIEEESGLVHKVHDVVFDEGASKRLSGRNAIVFDEPDVANGSTLAIPSDASGPASAPASPNPVDIPLPPSPTGPAPPRRTAREVRLTERGAAYQRDIAEQGNRRDPRNTSALITRGPPPNTYEEAMLRPDATQWREAMQHEVDKFAEHGTYTLVPPDPSYHVLGTMWHNTVKVNPDGTNEYRARCVVRGDQQRPGLEFDETFATAGDNTAFRYVTALSTQFGYDLTAVDISSAYLHSPLNETIYIRQMPGFEEKGKETWVGKLHKALYGLKQGGRAWREKFVLDLDLYNLKPLISAPSVFFRSDAEGEVIMATHVDDCTAATTPKEETARLKSQLDKLYKYKDKDLSQPVKLLGTTVDRDANHGTVKISVPIFVDKLLIDYKMTEANSISTPMADNALILLYEDQTTRYDKPPFPYRALIGGLNWAALMCRPDIAYSVNVLARYSAKPSDLNWDMAKRILRYLKGTRTLGITYRREGESQIRGYSDADWAGDPKDRKSTIASLVMFMGGAISWRTNKWEASTPTSSCESEYYGVSETVKEALWFRSFLSEIGRPMDAPFPIHTDNQSAIAMAKNPVYQRRTKHVDIAAHHVRHEINNKHVELIHISGKENPADILTKPLARQAFQHGVELLGMHSTLR